MTEKKRPTSPHIQIYKWNISSFTSIMHRATGIALYLSIVAITWYVIYYTYQINVSPTNSSQTCECAWGNFMKFIIWAAIISLTFSLYYHFCNGIRHLFWDIGKGFNKETAKTNGFLVISLAIILTVCTIGFALFLKIF